MFLQFLREHWILAGAFVLVFIMLLIEEARAKGVSGALTPQGATHAINREGAGVLDIRSEKQFTEGHIVGALNISQDNLERDMKKLNKFKNKPIIVVCSTGQKASGVVAKLKKAGYNATMLSGGVVAWSKAGMPLVKK